MDKTYYNNASEEEKKFLDKYSPGDWKRPAVTADIVVFTVNPVGMLCVVLIQRKGYPYKGAWALPGGFLRVDEESVGETAVRELKEETGLSGVFLQQLKTYSEPERDPRMHVISVAHFALVPYSKISIVAGDDASDVDLFEISKLLVPLKQMNSELGHSIQFLGDIFQFVPLSYGINLEASLEEKVVKGVSRYCTVAAVKEEDLAFDHFRVIKDAIQRLQGRKDYCEDLFDLLEDKNSFTVSDYKKIYDAVSFEKSDNANFRKMFKNRYVKTGVVEMLNKKTVRGAELYTFVGRSYV